MDLVITAMVVEGKDGVCAYGLELRRRVTRRRVLTRRAC